MTDEGPSFLKILKANYCQSRTMYAFITNQKWTTASRDVMGVARRAGLMPLMEQDFVLMLRDNSRDSKIHWLPLHLKSMWPSNINIVMFHDKHPILIGYLRKLGFTIVTNVNCMITSDIIFDNIKTFDMATANVQVSGNRLTMSETKLVDKLDDVVRGSGYMIRDTLMQWCQRRWYTYVGLGDEIESIVHARSIKGLKSRHIVDEATWNKLESSLAQDVSVGVVSGGSISYVGDGEVRFIITKPSDYKLATIYSEKYDVPIITDSDYAHMLKYNKMGWYDKHHIICVNALEYQPMVTDFLVGIYSLSNINNPKPETVIQLMLEKKAPFVVNFPQIESYDEGDHHYSINYEDGTIIEYVNGRMYSDWFISNTTMLHLDVSIISGPDITTIFGHDLNGVYHPPSSWISASRNANPLKRWGFVTSRGIFDDYNQTWKNSQTQWARYVSVGLRVHYNLYEEFIYRLRILAAKLIDDSVNEIDDPKKRITGTSDTGPFSVSGHLINLMLFSHIGTFDIKRYLRTVLANIRLSSGVRISERQRDYLNANILAEDNSIKTLTMLWHNIYEFRVGVATYIIMCKMLGWRVKMKLVSYVIKWLNSVSKIYPDSNGPSMEVILYLRSLGKRVR